MISNGLVGEVSTDEIKNAIFSIGGLKAPGSDGYPASFYHNHWNLVSDDVYCLVKDIFHLCKISEGLNHTMITLVPKTASPQHMHLFRPISLCSTLYKTVTKIIVARMRPLLCKLISPNQTSYVPGRHI